jgi:hypothetical protein
MGFDARTKCEGSFHISCRHIEKQRTATLICATSTEGGSNRIAITSSSFRTAGACCSYWQWRDRHVQTALPQQQHRAVSKTLKRDSRIEGYARPDAIRPRNTADSDYPSTASPSIRSRSPPVFLPRGRRNVYTVGRRRTPQWVRRSASELPKGSPLRLITPCGANVCTVHNERK